MDAYMKTLSITNNIPIEDIAYPCIKILDWAYKISNTSNNQLASSDVPIIAKAIVFLNTCQKMYGNELTEYLLEKYSFYEKPIQTYFRNSIRPFAASADIFENIATRNDSATLLCSLERICSLHYQQNVHSSPLSTSLSYTALHLNEDTDSEKPQNKLILMDLLQNLLQLPSDQINIAIKRILNYVPFSVIGLIFCEPSDSCYSDICLIIADKICQQVLDASISQFFIRSLYHCIASSTSGRHLLWLCLENVSFADAIAAFLVKALLERFKEQPNFFETPELFLYKEHKLNHILYLVWTIMDPQSPTGKNLYQSIAETYLLESILEILRNFDCIYE